MEVGFGERDESRKGDWICTYTGRRFWPLDPRAGDFNIEDIAHALAHMCRFNGHARYFYSVAQHSVLVMDMVRQVKIDNAVLRWALLHDAAEAYICDVPRPLKYSREFGDTYFDIERRIEVALCEQYDIRIAQDDRNIVKHADNVLLYSEAHALMPRESVKGWHWPPSAKRQVPIMPWTPCAAREKFLKCFNELA